MAVKIGKFGETEYVKKNIKITNSEYQKLCKVSERTALRDLDKLSTKGILQKKEKRKEKVSITVF